MEASVPIESFEGRMVVRVSLARQDVPLDKRTSVRRQPDRPQLGARNRGLNGLNGSKLFSSVSTYGIDAPVSW